MYKHIMVAVDGSQTSNLALEEAIRLAGEQHASLKLIHVVDQTLINWDEGGWLDYSAMQEALSKAGQKIIDDAAQRVRAAGLETETAVVESVARRLADVIAEEAGRWPADLIVMGTHGRRGFDRLLLGSVAEGVVRTAPAPVLLIKKGG
jgi:nucleotide-binding universal stress UspA family protein